MALNNRFGLQLTEDWNMLEMMGYEESISSNGKHWGFEDNRFERLVTVKSNVADPGAGGDITFQLDAGDIDTYGNYYPREAQHVIIPKTGVVARISLIAGTSPNIFITMQPLDSNDNIGALTAGQQFALAGNSYAAGTDQGRGIIKGYTKRIFDLQRIKDDWEMEGDSIAQVYWFETFSPDGKSQGFTPVTNAYIDAHRRYDAAVSGMFFYGKMIDDTGRITQTTPNGITNNVSTAAGLLPTAAKLGWVNHISPGAFVVEDLDDIGLYMRTQGVTSNVYLHLIGADRYIEVENACKTFLQGNGTDFTKAALNVIQGADKEAKAVALGFSEIFKGQGHHIYKVVNRWSNPVGVGAADYDYKFYDVAFPMTSKQDPVTGKKLSNLISKYVDRNGYNRKLEYWETGGAGGRINYTETIDRLAGHMRGHRGFDLYSMNQVYMNVP
jgi:hypothetical protein